MNDIDCPYCGHSQEVNHDDGANYEESVNHEMECNECEKNFVFQTCISFDYYPEKADCLNGGDHDFKASCTYPRQYTKMCCTMCDEKRDCTADEMREICVGSIVKTKLEAKTNNT